MPLAPVMKRSVSLPMKTRVTYEYLLKTQPVFASDAFQFVVPQGALLYGADPLKKRKAKDYKTIREQLLKQHDTVFPRN
jgi:hypothetical protein